MNYFSQTLNAPRCASHMPYLAEVSLSSKTRNSLRLATKMFMNQRYIVELKNLFWMTFKEETNLFISHLSLWRSHISTKILIVLFCVRVNISLHKQYSSRRLRHFTKQKHAASKFINSDTILYLSNFHNYYYSTLLFLSSNFCVAHIIRHKSQK